MQTINQLTASISQNNQKPSFTQNNSQEISQHTKPASTTTISSAQVGEMFAKWKIYFKSKMKKEEWGITNVLLWTAVLNEFDITEQELIAGTTKACFAKELNGWPPTTATDFIQVIRGSLDDNSYPDMRSEYLAAAQGQYRHEVTLETAKRVGTWELKTQPESISWKAWLKEYPIVCSEHSMGAEFKVPQSHQVAYEHTPVQADSPFNAKLDEFFRQFGSKTV